jgi:MraZ protein
VEKNGGLTHAVGRRGQAVLTDFKGTYPYRLDEKNRLTIPARFRKILKEAGEASLVLSWHIVDPCLVIYPKSDYDFRTEELRKKVNQLKSNQRAFYRNWTRYAVDCMYDGQGRITLPAELMKIANIQSDILIIGNVDKILIWDPLTLERIDQEQQMTEDDYNDLGNELLF